jgi:hypothetical protein
VRGGRGGVVGGGGGRGVDELLDPGVPCKRQGGVQVCPEVILGVILGAEPVDGLGHAGVGVGEEFLGMVVAGLGMCWGGGGGWVDCRDIGTVTSRCALQHAPDAMSAHQIPNPASQPNHDLDKHREGTGHGAGGVVLAYVPRASKEESTGTSGGGCATFSDPHTHR